jgi:hypothetical protein
VLEICPVGHFPNPLELPNLLRLSLYFDSKQTGYIKYLNNSEAQDGNTGCKNKPKFYWSIGEDTLISLTLSASEYSNLWKLIVSLSQVF